MKKLLSIIALGIFLVSGVANAKVEEMTKQVGDLKVKIAMEMSQHNEDGHHGSGEEEHHNSMGSNKISVTIFDSENSIVKNAKVKIDYSMPPQDNMPPMKYTARAKLAGETYDAKLNFSMKGSWSIMVYIKEPGKKLAKVNFNMHVM
jgi:hypothetical protein